MLRIIVTVVEMQVGFMPVSMLRRLQEECHAKGKKVVYVLCGPRESS